MYDNDDIMNKIDKLHDETTKDIKEIKDDIVNLDKKVDIHIEVAKVLDEQDEKNIKSSTLTKNQKWGIFLTGSPIIVGIITFILTN